MSQDLFNVIDLEPTELGCTVYVEIIIVRRIFKPYTGTLRCTVDCGDESPLLIHRQIFEPGLSIAGMVGACGYNIDGFIPHKRDFDTNLIVQIGFNYFPSIRDSILLFPVWFGGGDIDLVLKHLAERPNILPYRMS